MGMLMCGLWWMWTISLSLWYHIMLQTSFCSSGLEMLCYMYNSLQSSSLHRECKSKVKFDHTNSVNLCTCILQNRMSGWVSEWVSEWMSEWVSEWVGECVSECMQGVAIHTNTLIISCKQLLISIVDFSSLWILVTCMCAWLLRAQPYRLHKIMLDNHTRKSHILEVNWNQQYSTMTQRRADHSYREDHATVVDHWLDSMKTITQPQW